MSVAMPLILGIAVALPIYKLIGPDKRFVAFALFHGRRDVDPRRSRCSRASWSSDGCSSGRSARWPSLARAIDDVTAWFLIALATAVATAGDGPAAVLRTIGEASRVLPPDGSAREAAARPRLDRV